MSSGRPVAGSRTSCGSPVPGCQAARKGPSQSEPASVGCSGANATIAVLLLGPTAGRGVAPDRPARASPLGQALLDVLGHCLRIDGEGELPRVAETLAYAVVRVVGRD